MTLTVSSVASERLEHIKCEQGAEDNRHVAVSAAGEPERAHWLSTNILPHEPALRSWLIRRYPEHVEDVIQSAYLKLLTLPAVGHIRDSKYYLFQVARRIIAGECRRNAIVKIEYHGEIHDYDMADEAARADRVAEGKEMLACIENVIQALPESRRQVLCFRRLDCLSLRQTAQALGISQSGVEKHLAGAMREIRTALATHSNEIGYLEPAE